MAQPRLPPSSVSTVPDRRADPRADTARRLGGAVAGEGLPVAGTGEEVAADPSRSVGATGVRRARSRRSSDPRPTATSARTGRSLGAAPAVAARSVSAAAAETVLSTRNAPTARRGRRAPRAPATTASTVTVATTPPMRTGLSAVPKVSIAHSLTGRGAASTARLATANSGDVTPVSSAATASAAATPAAPASRPATPPATTGLVPGDLCDPMWRVRRHPRAGWVFGTKRTRRGRVRRPRRRVRPAGRPGQACSSPVTQSAAYGGSQIAPSSPTVSRARRMWSTQAAGSRPRSASRYAGSGRWCSVTL